MTEETIIKVKLAAAAAAAAAAAVFAAAAESQLVVGVSSHVIGRRHR